MDNGQAYVLLVTAAALLVVASLGGPKAFMRGGFALAGAVALAGWAAASWSTAPGGAVIALLMAAFMAINLFHLAVLMLKDRRRRFSPEEARMVKSVFSGLDRRQARLLVDQGLWVDGQADEVLTRENEPVSHLYYLAEGAAEVTSLGMWIATLQPPALVGEMTVLEDAGATASVKLDGPARYWCVPALSLRRFLAEHPDIRLLLERSFAGAVGDKLRRLNRTRAKKIAATV